MSEKAERNDFVISRVFGAPRELLWRCFTEPEHMQQWWGPKGSTVVSGTYHGAMRDSSGHVTWAKFVYREIVPQERLVWVHSFSDENGGLARHPLSPTWPLELLTNIRRRAGREDQAHATLVAAQCDRGRAKDLRYRA